VSDDTLQQHILDLTRAAESVPRIEEENCKLAARVDALESALKDAAAEFSDQRMSTICGEELVEGWYRDGLLKEKKPNG
jgi:hypothetical protein